jgi:hypothetical protein
VTAESWRASIALELRYDGPIPASDPPPLGAAEALRRRMRLHRRLALDFALQAGSAADSGRSLAHLAAERRAHSRLARLLGAALRRG